MNSNFTALLQRPRAFLLIDIAISLPFLILPLFLKLPYRVNIFLSWEGAYRLSIGQVPFEDFGLPMGFMYWVIPALFFKFLGPTMMTLVKAQVFINLISLMALRGIMYNLKIRPIVVTFGMLIFCLTYVIYNFWPWYNHTVVVYELVALYFLTGFDKRSSKIGQYSFVALAGLFSFVSFFTKQDAGGICFLICLFLFGYHAIKEKAWGPVLVFTCSFLVVGAALIIPFIDHNFSYWFNYGQPPHSSRIDIRQLLDIVFNQSLLEKVYLLLILTGIISHYASFKSFILDKNQFIATVISVALIAQSIVIRLTSPLPTDHMNYFHTFAFLGVAVFLPWENWVNRFRYVFACLMMIMLLFSAGYWKYLSAFAPAPAKQEAKTDKVQSKPWAEGKLKSLKRVTLPPETNDGIDRIMALPFLEKEGLRVLNMSELTSLAYEIGYTPLTHHPLWFHLNIGIFEKEVNEINNLVRDGFYDLVLFESIPSLTDFYPYAVRDQLLRDYIRIDSFLAPRKLEDSIIEVFVHPDLASQYGLRPDNDQTTKLHNEP
jgi:hypothetical protein